MAIHGLLAGLTGSPLASTNRLRAQVFAQGGIGQRPVVVPMEAVYEAAASEGCSDCEIAAQAMGNVEEDVY